MAATKERTMPETTPKAPKETWEDWLHPNGRDAALLNAEPVLTRDELVAELHSRGYDVSARDLIYWQTRGAIPYPVRQKRHGSSVAVYPQWMINVIHTLRDWQQQGYKLREIGPLMRGYVYHLFSPLPQTAEQEIRHAHRRARQALYPLLNDLEAHLRSLARVHERMHDDHIIGAEVRLVRKDGTGETYLFSTGAESESNTPVDDANVMV